MFSTAIQRSWRPHAKLLTLFAAFAVLVGVLPLVSAYLLVSTSETAALSRIEAQSISHDSAIARDAIASRITSLQQTDSDYAAWNAMQQAVHKSDLDFLRANLPSSVLSTYHLSSAMVLDNAQHVVYQIGAPVVTAVLPRSLLTSPDVRSAVVAPGDPMLIVSAPIVRESPPLARAGTMVFGQRIDSAFVRDMATSASNPIVVFPASGDSAVSSSTQFDSTLLAQFRSVARGSQKLVRLGAWAIMSSPLTPAGGADGPLLAVVESRQATLSAEHDLRLRALASFGLVLVLAVLGGLALSRWILWPLGHLSVALRSLRMGAAAVQVAPARWGAMGELLRGFNQLSADLDAIVRERAVVEARERLASIVESAPDAIISTSSASIIESWNAGATSLYGFTAEEALGQPISIIAAAGQDDAQVSMVCSPESGQTATPCDTVRTHKSGRRVHVSLTVAPILDSSGAAIGSASIAHDITARLRAEAALRESEAQYRLLAENSTDLIARMSPAGVFLFTSPAAMQLLGYSPEELVGQSSLDLWHPDERDANRTASQAILSQPAPHTVIHRMRRKDGAYAWFETIFQSVRDTDNGAVVELHTASRDFSARKVAEDALRVTETRLRAVVSHAPLVLFALDRRGTFTLYEASIPGAWGTAPHPQVGDSVVDWLTTAPLTALGRRALSGEPFSESVEIADLIFEVWWTPERDSGGEFCGGTGVAVDVTATEQARRAAERAHDAALELARLRTDFVASVSHELRTPLTSIVGYGELLQAHWDQFDESQRRDRLGRMVLAANRQIRLVEDLLLLTRLDNDLTPQTVLFDIAQAARRVSAELIGTYPGQRLDLTGEAELFVRADADWTLQILANLFDNAAKYSPDGSPIGVCWGVEGGAVVVRVQDAGCGIPNESQDQLFTRFGRISGSRIRAGHVGTGLGLHLGRRFARVMGGELSLERSGPTGSVFQLQLPACVPGERV
jgi:PAS domain S-box-containing protein